MDAAIGACWRCGQPGKLKCPDCEFGLYCGHMCVSDDKYRHKIECFHAKKNKTCHVCKKVTQSAKQCSACLTVWYCGRECQRRDWGNHKRKCLEEEQKIRDTVKCLETDFFSLLYNRDKKPDTFVHVCYWGNTPAIDLLKLPQNEFSNGCRPETLCLLLSGVGDLRYVIKTGASLPDDFNGRVDFYLNDIDVHVLARNALFIYMICRSHDLKAVAQDLVQIWYSLCFTIDICEHLECRLEELIHISSHNLMKETQKALIVSDADLDKMKVLWSQWLKLSKTGGPRQHILKQRQAVHSCGFEVEKDWISYLNSVPQRHQKSLREFWKDGLLMSASNPNKSEAVFQNITLLCDDPSRHEDITSFRQQFPSVGNINDILPEWYKTEPLVYTIPAETLPFTGWDYVDAKSHSDVPNLSIMYSNYISHMIEKFAQHVRSGRMSVQILLCDCFKLDKEIDSSQVRFDRISTSNLCDYFGLPDILDLFKPFLNTSNPCSVIITESISWASKCINDQNPIVDFSKISADTGIPISQSSYIYQNRTAEDYIDVSHLFLRYLRAEFLKSPRRQFAKKIPTLSEIANYDGLKLRDFYHELNRVIPHRWRLNIRRVTEMPGSVRNLEWLHVGSETQSRC